MHYDFECPWGEIYCLEMQSVSDVERWANDWFERQCKESPMKNGEQFYESGFAVLVDDGVILKRKPVCLHYEHYHGDFIEHNTVGM